MKRSRLLIAFAVIGTTALAPTAASGAGGLVPVLEHLDGPRGVAVGPAGRVIFGQADGSVTELLTKGRPAGSTETRGVVPAGGFAPAVTMNGRGETFALTSGGEPGSGAATLFRLIPGQKKPRVVADIAAYQATDEDPYNSDGGDPAESNPYGVAALPDGSVLVSDAANNDLLRVYPNGRIVTVARIMPRVVPMPGGYPDEIEGQPLPPEGTPIPSEGVATSVTVGADGYYYLGELRGFPATPGTSQVWRIAPNTVNAVCDPEAPSQGKCQRYADGFTSIVDLAAGPDGSIYVLELAKDSWLAMETGGSPIGGLFRILPGGKQRVELAENQLILPGGVAVSQDGKVYVTGPIFGEGVLARVTG